MHTPGPWVLSHDEHDDTREGRRLDFGIASNSAQMRPWIATTRGQYGTTATEREGNARLIAAAPELLEALATCLGWMVHPIVAECVDREQFPEYWQAVDAAEAAITKARDQEAQEATCQPAN